MITVTLSTMIAIQRRAALLALGSLLFAGQLPAQILFQGEASDTLTIRRAGATGTTVTDEQRVEFHHLTPYDHPSRELREIVAKSTLTTSRQANMEGSQSAARVEFYNAGANGVFPKKATHTLKVPNVHQVDFRDDYLEASTHGCCGSENYIRLYSFKGDKPFLRFNTSYAKIEIPNSGIKRYVGALLRSQITSDAADEAIFGSNTSAVAAITYGAPDQPMKSLLLEPTIEAAESSKNQNGTRGQSVPVLGNTAGIKVASISSKDEIYDPGSDNLPVELQMFSLDPEQDGQESLKKPDGISGLLITASFLTLDGTTETVSTRIDNDKFSTPEFTGKILKAVNP